MTLTKRLTQVAGMAAGAIGLIVLGAAPMAAAQASPVADTILAQAINGPSAPLNYPAPAFSLTDPSGVAALNAEVTRQAAMVAYIDDFKLMMLIVILAAPLLLLLRKPRPARALAAAE